MIFCIICIKRNLHCGGCQCSVQRSVLKVLSPKMVPVRMYKLIHATHNQRGKILLDADVAPYITNWNVQWNQHVQVTLSNTIDMYFYGIRLSCRRRCGIVIYCTYMLVYRRRSIRPSSAQYSHRGKRGAGHSTDEVETHTYVHSDMTNTSFLTIHVYT